MKKFKKSEYTQKLSIDPLFIKEGSDYGIKNKLKELYISPLNIYIDYGFKNSKELYGFVLNTMPLIKNNIVEHLHLSDHIKIDNTGINGLYSIPNLKLLSFEDKSFKLDFSKLSQLEGLYFKYNKGIKNLEALNNLKDLLIFSLNVTNCEIISKLTTLEMLRLIRGNFTTLKGVEGLKKVTRFDVAYNSRLTDAKAIASLSSLEKLYIEKCKLLTDFSFLKGNASIKELFIDNLDSIGFISTMPNLERVNFWSCKDGNMHPLLESKSLKQINFHPNKRHYTHTIEEVIELTGAQRGRHK